MYQDTEDRAVTRLKCQIAGYETQISQIAIKLVRMDGTRPLRQGRLQADLDRAKLELKEAKEKLEDYYAELARGEETNVLVNRSGLGHVTCRDSR